MLCLSGFELYSRWVPLCNAAVRNNKTIVTKRDEGRIVELIVVYKLEREREKVSLRLRCKHCLRIPLIIYFFLVLSPQESTDKDEQIQSLRAVWDYVCFDIVFLVHTI